MRPDEEEEMTQYNCSEECVQAFRKLETATLPHSLPYKALLELRFAHPTSESY